MPLTSERQIALASELLAERLLQVYRNEQVEWSVEGFARAGFTRTALRQPTTVFRMIVIAAYDRRPFTGAAGGFERLWEMDGGSTGIATLLESVDLWSPDAVLATAESDLDRRLSGLAILGTRLDGQGTNVRYCRALLDAARVVDEEFVFQLSTAKAGRDIAKVFASFDSVHGIGETIAAKLTKYTLREIATGFAEPADFPLSVAWPLTREYHVKEASRLLHSLHPSILPLTAGLLAALGDAFAVDSLFYLNRHRRAELEEFVSDWPAIPRQAIAAAATSPERDDPEVCQQLLAIIQEIVNDGLAVTQAELDHAGLRGIMTRQRIAGSCQTLLQGMTEHARQNNPGAMLAFYENCLASIVGQDIGWALGRVGRKSMESEAARFRAIASRDSSTDTL